ncbi:putative serine/threonine-protein kinase isoform X1 [Olea europaea var. sylvestris]|uniref:putative serine/threonine-protein kinase isoform X1 n=1 Tax=Olea europaea var. sylvestris TaxID=158386 RepID=UPI000C1CE562|nr:putative serine/threonine-protein kinase isoform X1 [Olea europaea var. sylvestris]XP_022848192.1 putative serine/threonine-protein kinase isoform X1 [Olea europaea var. sylvestris]XP_022848193.1 putative serine/threonine-protein kinase isoform X1 [Olea europaea var. sylvestris]XP_022848194.1 putative serine/threonine-protein kinase isoform X1 [Olea europaea var. sylvestris]XP_022848195.1 putative serine/threonine-protein kinase isoform X1 [Olea europaea var. sylvestris]
MSCSCFGAFSGQKKYDNRAIQSTQGQEGNSMALTKNFSYNELRIATENFHQRNKIGRGGFGTVYKGILKNQTRVAVKTLSAESKQGEREFLTEIETISNVKHPNLVELLGCCLHESNRILIYEYLENNSLDRALLGSRRTINLDWKKRSAICMGTARGLAYLHEEIVPHIVHRDVKASNILLDRNFEPKIGDFGLAKLFPDDITHISTKVAGTTGYLAPEYALGGQLTMKADVYSFGVLTLEIVSGRGSGNTYFGGMQKLLVEWAYELYEEERLLELVDPELEEFPKEEVLRYMKVALFCTQANASRRPVMSQVMEMLSRNVRLNEKELTPPGFFQSSGQVTDTTLKNKSSESSTSQQMSSFPLSITQVTPR